MDARAAIASLACLLAAPAVAACGGDEVSESAPGEPTGSAAIPQPTQTELEAAGLASFPFAPENARIDIAAPTFSNPTEITNPLNPVSELPSSVVLGEVDGAPLRIEITLLPETRIVRLNGQPVECVVSQFVGYLDGRMKEVALDIFAQSDDGAVWYFGEDVFNYGDDGHIADMEGAWLAPRDGPPGMITPHDPEVGDAYRSENIPGLVFEESTVKAVDVTVDGPLGPVDGAFEIDEHHPEGPEVKQWAPGYGEFYTRDGRDFELMALAVPTDARPGATPQELTSIFAGAAEIFGASGAIDWARASTTADEMAADWGSYRSADVPDLLAGQMNDALESLDRAIRAREVVGSRLAAIGTAVASLDLQLQYRPPAEIDLARLDVQAAMLAIDAAAGDLSAVRSDVANLDWIRDRIAHTLAGPDRGRLDTEIVEATAAAGDEDLPAAREIAGKLRAFIAGVTPVNDGRGADAVEAAAATTGAALPRGAERVRLDPAHFTTQIDNPYWPLTPGDRRVYRVTDPHGATERAVATVTDNTRRTAAGVTARVVYTKVFQGDEVIEDNNAWYAQDGEGNVWYLGERARELDHGRVVTTDGSWEAGADGAQPGVVMPADPQVGLAYRQEHAAGVAEDRAEVFSLDEQAETPFGTFRDVVMTWESEGIERRLLDLKVYARDVGLVLGVEISAGSGREELVRFSPGT